MLGVLPFCSFFFKKKLSIAFNNCNPYSSLVVEPRGSLSLITELKEDS